MASQAAKTRAEELFSASSKKEKAARKEQDKAQQKRAEHLAGLRALRLAKEAADKEAAALAAAAKAKKA